METMNEKIKRIRKSKGLSQNDVASHIGITQPSFASIESGRTKSISIDLGEKIAKMLDVSFNDLFGIRDSQNNISLSNKIEQLEKRISELESQLEDKRKLLLTYEDTADYFELFNKYSTETLLGNNDISALKLFSIVIDRITKEKGSTGLLLSGAGFRVKYFSEDEMKLLKKATEKINK